MKASCCSWRSVFKVLPKVYSFCFMNCYVTFYVIIKY